MIDLRSDTGTRPTPAMRAAMMHAEVGDDVFGEDPTVNALEERMAALFGHEASVFCPSGTMTNQIAVNIHTRPGDEVICDEGAHIYRYEGGGVMATSGSSVKLIQGDHGRFTAEQVEASINDRKAHWLAHTSLVNIENTCNRGGGAVWDLREVDRIRNVCDAHGLGLHLDGARIFNALTVTGEAPEAWGRRFDTLSVARRSGPCSSAAGNGSPPREGCANGWAVACGRRDCSRRHACMRWTTTCNGSLTITAVRRTWNAHCRNFPSSPP